MSPTRLRSTIRTRLTGAAVTVTALMLAVASVAIIFIQRQSLTAALDESLRQRADNLEPIAPGANALPPEGDSRDSFAQLVDGSGHVVASSLRAASAPAAARPRPNQSSSSFATAKLDQPAGRYRLYVRPVATTTQTLYLVVGRNLDDISDSVRILSITLAVVSPALVLMLGLLAWWLTGRTLRPVEAIREEVQDIHAGELHRRVPVPDTEDEIAELARTMNGMLDRVEAASARQQQFVDDASHELRTPLTRMMADLEIAIAHPDDEPPPATLQRVLEHAADLRRLLHDLLFLARSSQGLAAASEVDLDDIALRVAHRLRAQSTVSVDTTGVEAARVIGDGRALERAVSNLLDNASRHARTQVAISTSARDGFCRVTIDDDGAGIPPADRDRVFERFSRLDEARSRSDGGNGLGLAIVHDIATRHGGHVTVATAPIGGARLILAIPAEEPHSEDHPFPSISN